MEFVCKRNVIGATVNALKDYFNAVLPTKLLYKQERAQYAEVTHEINKFVLSSKRILFFVVVVIVGQVVQKEAKPCLWQHPFASSFR